MKKNKNIKIYHGELIKPISIYTKSDPNAPIYLQESSNEYLLITYQFYRDIFLTIDDQNKGIDLLYRTPHYPILGKSSIEEIIKQKLLIQNLISINKNQLQYILQNPKEYLQKYDFTPHQEEGQIRKRTLKKFFD